MVKKEIRTHNLKLKRIEKEIPIKYRRYMPYIENQNRKDCPISTILPTSITKFPSTTDNPVRNYLTQEAILKMNAD